MPKRRAETASYEPTVEEIEHYGQRIERILHDMVVSEDMRAKGLEIVVRYKVGGMNCAEDKEWLRKIGIKL